MNPILPTDFKPIIGTEDATIDDKGRLLVSKKKRERLGADFAMTVGMVGCIVCLPEWLWTQTHQEVFGDKIINHQREDYARTISSFAEDELNFDQQGRVVIPKNLLTAAKLPKNVLVVGASCAMELWDPNKYAQWEKEREAFEHERRDAFGRAYIQMTGRIQ